MPKKPVRQRQERPKRKPGNKNPTQTKRRLEAQLEVIQSKLARLNGRSTRQQEPEDEPVARDDYMNRMVVKFYWLQLGKPTGPIVAHKGGVVPDYKAQHDGCSKRKRTATAPCRIYTPSTEVAKIASERRLELRAEARRLAGD